MKKIDRIYLLVKKLNQARHEYYNLSNPDMSDTEYDKLFDELSNLEKETDFILSNSPTQEVGYEVRSKLKKVKHSIPLRSLDKTKSIDELNRWKKDRNVLEMLKADGLTIELIYDKGELIQASTRGNAFVGQDITHNAKTFKNLPLKISFKGKLKLAGEAIIHWHDFEKINNNLTKEEKKKLKFGKYKTPRNLVSGSVSLLDSKICKNRNVYFYAFTILESNKNLSNSKAQNFNWLESIGFNVIPFNRELNDIQDYDIGLMKERAKEMGMPIDGLVYSFDSVSYSNSLGETSHHPLHSLAYKFDDEIQETILRDVEWSVGRTGNITPVAIFDTINLDNTDVSRANVHNLSILKELQLGIGDIVKAYKANQIIPQILENVTRSNNVIIPDKCPICGEKTQVKKDYNTEVLICTNPNCTAKLLKRFSHFVSRDAMNIEGLSEATLEKFINKGWLKTFNDIYKLGNYKTEIIQMEGFGLKSFNNLMDSILKSVNVRMENFLYALGINQIGKTASKTIAEYFNFNWGTFEKSFIECFDFTQLKDFGSVMHFNLYEWFNDDQEKSMWSMLPLYTLRFIKQEKEKIVDRNSIFNGKKVYCTGKFANFKKQELKDKLESLGAIFTSGYAKSLDYLIVGSLKGSSKEDKAKKDNIPILTEDEIMKMI